MAFLHFYNPKTYEHARDLTADIVNSDFTVGLNGSLSGNFTVKETDGNRAFLQSINENSHFVKFGHTKVYGGVTESPRHEKNIWTINFCGAYEYLEKVDAVAAHKASSSFVVRAGDYSHIKVFYADAPVGVLWEVLGDLKTSMKLRSYDESLIDRNPLRAAVESTTDWEWKRSYRLNSAEVTTMKSVIDDILKDDGMQLFRIRVSSNLSEKFSFIFEVVSSSSVIDLQESLPPTPTSSVSGISFDHSNVERRSFSIAKGTDWLDRDVVEAVWFDSDMAYSALITTAPQEQSESIKRTAQTALVNAGANHGTLKFTSFIDSIDPLNYVSISSARMASVSGIITEKMVQGSKVTYSMQIGDPSAFNGALQKAPDERRKIIFGPLNSTKGLSEQTAGRKPYPTGWRS